VHRPETISNALFMSQSRHTAYSLPTSTGPDLQLTAARCSGMLCNCHHPCNPVITWITTHLLTPDCPEGWKAESAWLVDW